MADTMKSENNEKVAVIGAGLAGSEAAWQLGKRGVDVTLFEMRPENTTPAHRTGEPAELVCSNSFKSLDKSNAHGLLKAELEAAGSLIMSAAKKSSVPAGQALAVDRDLFSAAVKKALLDLPSVRFCKEEVTSLNRIKSEFRWIVLATGPLTSDALAEDLKSYVKADSLFFYDSIAPVVFKESINMDVAFAADRYGKGDSDYINCPMSRDEYEAFVEALNTAEFAALKDFEKSKYFEGCLPIEVMSERGIDTLSFGPMKPVGFEDPRTGKMPHAILQLRQENKEGTLYNMVGCQTKMTYPEQRRVFKMIPGLENADFARLGSMHRNTYLNAPDLLNDSLQIKGHEQIFVAGQLTGVEGYTESTAMGMWAAMQVIASIKQQQPLKASQDSMIEGLVYYLTHASKDNFQPMNANFGLLPPLKKQGMKRRMPKKEKRQIIAEESLKKWNEKLEQMEWKEA